MICLSLTAGTEKEALSNLETAEKTADVIELRLDLLPRSAWELLLTQRRNPCIVTLRPERQGGRFKGDERSRIRLLEKILTFKPAYIDLEWDTPLEWIESIKKRKGETRLILSYHDFQETSADLQRIWERINALRPDLVKMVTQANLIEDNVRILELAQKQNGRTIAFCMGPIGIPSRILTLRFGGLMTYGCLKEGKESAPGQIPVKELKELYRVKEITKETRVYGLLGNPVFHSLSPTIHNSAFQNTGIDGVYVPFQVTHLKGLLPALSFMGVRGFSVTIPHKEGIIPLLDEVDEKAGMVGAVNTVSRRGGRWVGSNTDGDGAWKALETADMGLRKKRWLILGAGGAARAMAFSAGMQGDPVSLSFLGRSTKRLEELIRKMRRHFSFPIDGTLISEHDFLKRKFDQSDIVVNCTPVGMFPNEEEIPIPPQLLSSTQLVFDTVYNPLETRLLKEARERGCRTVSGLPMFLFQGGAQFVCWTTMDAPLDLMRKKVLERLGR